MTPVRFLQNNSLIHCEGLLHYEVGRLHLEYRLVDGICGIWKGKVKHARIPLADIASIEVVKGWFWDHKIVLQARTMETVQGVPGMSRGRVELPIAHADRAAARLLVDGLRKPALVRGADGDL